MQWELKFDRIHLSDAEKAHLASYQADRAADEAAEHADDASEEAEPPAPAPAPALADDYSAEDADDDYDPLEKPHYKHELHGWYTWTLFLQLTPLLLVGLTAIALRALLSFADAAPRVHRVAHSIRRYATLPLMPRRVFGIKNPLHGVLQSWFNGCSIIEFLLYAWLIVPMWIWIGHDMKEADRLWPDEIWHVVGIEEPTKAQWMLNNFAIDLGILFIYIGPFLFLPAARGSLINSFLGVHYGTMIKWHRWVGTMTIVYILLHGILYNVLWGTVDGANWAKEAFKWEGGISNAAGNVAGLGALLIGVTALPYIRRSFYWVFYRAHIIGALLFTVFAVLHWSGNLAVSMIGLVIYGMDVAYRWFQTSYRVDVRVDEASGTRIMSIVVPLEKAGYDDGCHVWIAFPDISGLQYHPFSIASTDANPIWRKHLLVQCKVYDKWTQKIVDRLAQLGAGTKSLVARVQGPFDGHTWSEGFESTFDKLIFASGGIGVTAVLPFLERAAMRRAQGFDGPPLMLIHTCRDAAELQILAPLLQHADHIDVHLHFTGKTAMGPCTLEAPNPHASALYHDTAAGTAAEAGSKPAPLAHMAPPAPRRLIPLIGDWRLEVVVLCIAVFWSFWAYAVCEFWYTSGGVPFHLYITTDEAAAKRGAAMNALAAFMLLTIVLVPLMVIMLWRTLARWREARRVQNAAGGGVVRVRKGDKGDADSDTGSYGSFPSAGSTAPAVSIELRDGGGYTLTSSGASHALTIQTGRPPLDELLGKASSDRNYNYKGLIGVWAAGPKPFNWAVANAAYDTGAKVEVHQLAFEL